MAVDAEGAGLAEEFEKVGLRGAKGEEAGGCGAVREAELEPCFVVLVGKGSEAALRVGDFGVEEPTEEVRVVGAEIEEDATAGGSLLLP